MRNFFLGVVAISALCSSCETTDETFLEQTNSKIINVQKTSSVNNLNYEIYNNVITSFVYNKNQTYTENVKIFEQHTNRIMNSYTLENIYELINLEQIYLLTHANESFINKLHYSTEFKETLHNILYRNHETVPVLKNEHENILINTLLTMSQDNKESTHEDDKWNDKRIIAFAYGAQKNFTQAVLYAGAIELQTKN